MLVSNVQQGDSHTHMYTHTHIYCCLVNNIHTHHTHTYIHTHTLLFSHSVMSDSVIPSTRPPGSSVQARILEWVAISFSTRSSWPRDQTHDSCIGRQILYHWATQEALLHLYTCIYIDTYMSIFFQILFPCRLLQNIKCILVLYSRSLLVIYFYIYISMSY